MARTDELRCRKSPSDRPGELLTAALATVEWAEEDAGTAKHAAILTIVEAGGTVAQTRLEAVTAQIIRGLTTDVGPPEVSSIGVEISHS